jgi:hypothetical protein
MEQLEQSIREAEANLANLKALRTRQQEGRGLPDAIELPGGGVINLREASRTQAAAQEKERKENETKVWKRLGLSEAGAAAAARGRYQGW